MLTADTEWEAEYNFDVAQAANYVVSTAYGF